MQTLWRVKDIHNASAWYDTKEMIIGRVIMCQVEKTNRSDLDREGWMFISGNRWITGDAYCVFGVKVEKVPFTTTGL